MRTKGRESERGEEGGEEGKERESEGTEEGGKREREREGERGRKHCLLNVINLPEHTTPSHPLDITTHP